MFLSPIAKLCITLLKIMFLKLFCRVSFIFGLTAMIAGIVGVPLGSFLGQRLRVK